MGPVAEGPPDRRAPSLGLGTGGLRGSFIADRPQEAAHDVRDAKCAAYQQNGGEYAHGGIERLLQTRDFQHGTPFVSSRGQDLPGRDNQRIYRTSRFRSAWVRGPKGALAAGDHSSFLGPAASSLRAS